MRIAVKNVKTWATNDGGGYQASIYFDGKRIGMATQHGNGGPMQFDLTKNIKQATDYAVSVYDADNDYQTDDEDFKFEMVIARLVDQWEENKQLKKYCKDKTVVQKQGETDYIVYNVVFSPEVKAKLLEKHQGEMIQFVNERFL